MGKSKQKKRTKRFEKTQDKLIKRIIKTLKKMS